MKIKTSELTGFPLRWAMSKANGVSEKLLNNIPMWKHIYQQGVFRYDTDWSEIGPIIAQMLSEGVEMRQGGPTAGNQHCWVKLNSQPYYFCGPTPQIAACRCFVASRLGDEVEIPEELAT